jgi:hypothetical protein
MEAQPNFNVKIFVDGKFCPAQIYQEEAYVNYRLNNNKSYHYEKDNIIFDLERSLFGYFFLVTRDGHTKNRSKIVAENDIKIQITRNNTVEWVDAYEYQKIAFLHFIGSGLNDLCVCSPDMDSSNIKNIEVFKLPSDFCGYAIKFTLLKKFNRVNYIRDNGTQTYITADPLHITECSKDNTIKIPTHDIKINESVLCKICFENDQDIIFLPCLHEYTCSKCWDILKTTKNRCPFCTKPVTATSKKNI